MKKQDITDYKLYQWRYKIGWAMLIFSIAYIIFIALFVAPKGITTAEMKSAVISSKINFNNLINLAYHLVQNLSIKLLGLSNFSIKLPTLIFGISSLALLMIMSKLWTDKKTAIIATLTATFSSQFIFFIQDGTPNIMVIFWTSLIMVILYKLLTFFEDKNYKKKISQLDSIVLALAPIIAISLYTPFSLIIILAIIVASLFHPHIRFVLRQTIKLAGNHKIILSLSLMLAIVAPLFWNLIKEPQLALQLIGLNENFNLTSNLTNLGHMIWQTKTSLNPHFIPTPLFNLAGLTIITIGLFRSIKKIDQFRKIIVLVWLAIAVIVSLISQQASITLFIPMYLLFAIGIKHLINSWYDIFPFNPYARVGGLIPITILIIGLVTSGIFNFVNSYNYDLTLSPQFRDDLSLLTKNINPQQPTTIVTDDQLEYDFYTILAKQNNNLKINRDFDLKLNQRQIVTYSIYKKYNLINIEKVLTDQFKNNSNRFYIYKNN